MQPGPISRVCAAVALVACSLGTQAADFSFSGTVVFNTEVVGVSFDVMATAGTVRLWTNSWVNGQNFDPDMALWAQQGGDYVLIAQNDDDDSIGSGQGFFDAGLRLTAAAAGHYLLTVGASPNIPNGTLLSQGFGFDPAYGSIQAQPIAQWNQPSYDPNANDQKGGFWRVALTGVENAAPVSSVPEPSAFVLAAAGLALIGWVRRRR